MKWVTKDYKGNPQVWYSEDEIKKYKTALKETQDEVLSVCKRCRTNVTSLCENCSFKKILRKAQKIDLFDKSEDEYENQRQ